MMMINMDDDDQKLIESVYKESLCAHRYNIVVLIIVILILVSK